MILANGSSDEYCTPWSLVRWLETELGYAFTLDPAATSENAKAPQYFTKVENGLDRPWKGRIFLNPPFSNIDKWVSTAVEQAAQGADVTMIVAVRSERSWWHDWVLPFAEIWYQHGRQHFTDPAGIDAGRPVFASAILRLKPGLPKPEPARSIPSIPAEAALPLLEAISQ